jgi:cysteine desulfurase
MDYAAASPLAPEVTQAMQPYLETNFYNPSATYSSAKQVRKTLDDARSDVAHWLGVKSSEIIFTAGATEANNLAIHGIMSRYPKGNIVVNAIEHESVLAPAGQYECREVSVGHDGRIDLQDLSNKIDDNTALVSVMYANNEIGTVQPLREIAKIINEKRKQRPDKPLYFHTDAAQAANYLDLHASRLGVDLMSINGGKIYGPKQSGALYVRAGIVLEPLVLGGGQERGLRSGTENVAGIVGFSKALELAQTMRHEELERLKKLRDRFLGLLEEKLPEVSINGSLKYRLPNNVHLTIPGQDNERLIFELDEAGIMAAAGSACSASSEEPSHVLKAIGVTDEEAQASLRFTMGRSTTEDDIDQTVQLLERLTT